MEINHLNQYVKFFSFILKYYNSDVLKSATDSLSDSSSEKESNEKLWINLLSDSFFTLKKMLIAKDFIKDFRKI